MTLHLVLTFRWFDETVSGRKRTEYRASIPRWEKDIWRRRHEIAAVKFSRGYTPVSATWAVLRVDRGPCPLPGWRGEFIRIHLGERQNEAPRP